MTSVGVVLKCVGILTGLSLMSVVFLSEDEEGQLQNVLERLWHGIEAAQSSALSVQAAFLQQIAKASSFVVDALFGHPLFSVRAISVSGCLSAASFLFGTALILGFVELLVQTSGTPVQAKQAAAVFGVV